MKARKQIIKVALVEDDPYYNRLLTKYVNTICAESFYPDFQFNIQSYASAHDCIEQLDDELNILILDYFLFNRDEHDVLSGADVLDEVNKHCDNCKVIVISALKSPSTILKLKQKGIYAYIDKNVNSRNRIGALLQTILDDLKQKRA